MFAETHKIRWRTVTWYHSLLRNEVERPPLYIDATLERDNEWNGTGGEKKEGYKGAFSVSSFATKKNLLARSVFNACASRLSQVRSPRVKQPATLITHFYRRLLSAAFASVSNSDDESVVAMKPGGVVYLPVTRKSESLSRRPERTYAVPRDRRTRRSVSSSLDLDTRR